MGKTRRGTTKKAHVRTLYPALDRLESTTVHEAAKTAAKTQTHTKEVTDTSCPASTEAEGPKESYPSA